MRDSDRSILDLPAISGRYLFPQPRCVREPFVVASDGIQLHCYRRIVDTDAYTLVHFHGNGEAVADYVPEMAETLESLGLNSLFVEYRQYGGSSGRAQLVAMLGDGQAALASARLPPDRAIVFGRSIGSLYAIELASREPNIGGLILESGIADPAERFLVYADLAAAGLDEQAVCADTKRYFDHQAKLAAYTGPLLIMHAQRDRLVDVSHAQRNHQWSASRQKRLLLFPHGDHNSIIAWNHDAYFEAIRSLTHTISQARE